MAEDQTGPPLAAEMRRDDWAEVTSHRTQLIVDAEGVVIARCMKSGLMSRGRSARQAVTALGEERASWQEDQSSP